MSDRRIRASAFLGEDGCEHQSFSQPVAIIHGTGPDEGTVTMQIGECAVTFESTEALIAGLQVEFEATAPPSRMPFTRAAGMVAVIAGLAGLINTIGRPLLG